MPSLLSSAVTLAGLLGAVSSASLPRDYGYGAGKAYLYFLQNDPKGSSIVAVDSDSKGKVTTVTSTGGKGASIFSSPGEIPTIDTLNTQGSVAVVDDVLLTVNAGSNTVALFKINPSDPLHPTLVGKPIDSLGDFPASVTYSRKLRQACVINGGTRNSVACFNVDIHKGLTHNGPARPLNLTLGNPPTFGKGLVSDITFSPDSSFVFADSKGPNGAGGSYYAWPVKNGEVSQHAVVTTIADMKDPFGLSFDLSNNRLFVSDTSYGGSVVTLSKDLKATEVKHQDEKALLGASCWAVYSTATSLFYAADAAKPHFGVYDPSSGDFLRTLEFDPKFVSSFDTLVDPRDAKILWFLSGTNAVAAFDIEKKTTFANLTISGKDIVSRQFWEGLGIYIAH